MDITNLPVGFLGTNCYILCSAKSSCAIIDPGAQPEKLAAEIEAKKLTVKYLLLTHGHHDHIGGVKKLMEKYTEAKLYIGKDDLEMLEDGEKSYAAVRSSNADEYLIKNAVALEEGQELELDELTIRALFTPGHTKGGVTFVCRDVLFSGDTLFRRDCGRTDLYGGDYEAIKLSLKKLSELEGDYTVYPGHGASTTLQYERVNNQYMIEGCAAK